MADRQQLEKIVSQIVRDEIRKMKAELQREIVTYIDNKMSAQHGQLIESHEKLENKIVANVHNEINQTIVPKLNAMMEVQAFNSMDGDEIITEYRRRLHSTVSEDKKAKQGNRKGVADPVAQQQQKMLFFNDDD